MIDYDKWLNKLPKFEKKDRSTFPYWISHFLAYNLAAIKLGVWHPKYLLHDIEKPWLKLFWGDYNKVQNWHRHHNSHHIFYGRMHGLNKIDWLGAIIDWEASRYTKISCERTALEEANYIVSGSEHKYTKDEIEEVRKNVFPIIEFLGLKS